MDKWDIIAEINGLIEKYEQYGDWSKVSVLNELLNSIK